MKKDEGVGEGEALERRSGTRGRDGREGRVWQVRGEEEMGGRKMGRGEYCFMLSGGIDATG